MYTKLCALHSGPDDITDELDFALFNSPEFSYDDLADLSLPLDDAGAEVFVDVTDSPESRSTPSPSLQTTAVLASTSMVDPAVGDSQ